MGRVIFVASAWLILVVWGTGAQEIETVQTTDWGPKTSGLQMRVTVPTEVSYGSPVRAKIELKAWGYELGSDLDGRTEVLRCPSATLSLHLRMLETGDSMSFVVNEALIPEAKVGDFYYSFPLRSGFSRIRSKPPEREKDQWLRELELTTLEFSTLILRPYMTRAAAMPRRAAAPKKLFHFEGLAEGECIARIVLSIPPDRCGGWTGELSSPEFNLRLLPEEFETDTAYYQIPVTAYVDSALKVLEERTVFDSILIVSRKGFGVGSTLFIPSVAIFEVSGFMRVREFIPKIDSSIVRTGELSFPARLSVQESSQGIGHMGSYFGWGFRQLAEHEWTIRVVLDTLVKE